MNRAAPALRSIDEARLMAARLALVDGTTDRRRRLLGELDGADQVIASLALVSEWVAVDQLELRLRRLASWLDATPAEFFQRLGRICERVVAMEQSAGDGAV